MNPLLATMQAVLAAAQPALGAGSQDALRSVGPQAAHILDLWRLTLGVCTAVFVAVLLALLWALWRAPRAAGDSAADAAPRDERRLLRSVTLASVVSAVLLLVLLVASFGTDRALAALSPRDALRIEVISHQWWWELRYAHDDVSQRFVTANELHVPVGRPVQLLLQADDVIHSFWVPNLGGKKDMIPGRPTTLMLRADRAGTYRGQCAEFCGAQHARMALLLVAHEPAAYEAWAAAQRRSAAPPVSDAARRGQQLFMTGTCAMCHAVQGTDASAQRAPDLTHLASRQTLAAGTLPLRADTLAAWITDPQRLKPGVRMPGHAFAPDDLQALVAYLQGLE
jgi:cytochrome c oxidase subunit 2